MAQRPGRSSRGSLVSGGEARRLERAFLPSTSATRTRRSCRAAMTPRAAAMVVFPTPPLPEIMRSLRSSMASRDTALMIPPRSYRAFLAHCLVPGLLGALLLSLATPAWSSTRSQGSSPAGGTVDYFELSGVIDPVSAQALTRVITSSEASRSTVLIVRLDTPGGLRVSVTGLVDRIRRARVPIVVWVAPQGTHAAGGGLFLAEAAPVLVMGPGTTLGPAVPV